jgi:ribosomal protein L37AE/L43A
MRGLAHNKLRNPHLFREAINRGLSVPKHVIPGIVESWPFPAFEDIEFDCATELFNVMRATYGVDGVLMQQVFASRQSRLLHIHYRHAYCSACLKESMRRTGFPIWRQTWCYTTSAYCVDHRRVLVRPRDTFTPERRIWDAYLYSREERPVTHSLFDRRIAGITIRVQQWIESLVVGQALNEGVETLYGLLLSKRTAFAPGGIASAGFSRTKQLLCKVNLDLHERIKFGLNDSDPHQRMGALLLIGWLSGIVSPAEIVYLGHHDHCVGRTLPPSPQQLGRLVTLALSAEEVMVVREKLVKLGKISSTMMSSFLEGLDEATSRSLRSSRPKR